MEQPQSEIESIELSIEDAKRKIDLREAMRRLMKNKDFITIIDDGYFESEAVRLVHLKSDPNMQDPDQQAFVVRAIDAIGTLRAYMSRIFQQGNSAENAMAAHETALEEVLSEDLSDQEVIN